MKNIIAAALVMLIATGAFSQLPLVYQKPSKAKELGAVSRSAILYVVIENEKRPNDAALVEAVKNYWSATPVKYMSLLEFTEKLKAGSLDKSNLYLYNNHSEYLKFTQMVVCVSMYSGYYLTNDPYQLVRSLKPRQAPGYLHFSSNNLEDLRGEPIKGYYSLMMKNFDHDIRYCADEANYTSRKKLKRKNSIYFFVPPETISGKTTLLVKEQTTRMVKSNKKGKRARKAQEKKREFVTDAYTNKKTPVVVFPEDVDHAIKKKDAQVLLYNGGCLYSAENGAACATSRHLQGGGLKAVSYATGLLISAASIVFFLQR
jgi:hypothetical protein